jgi:hypothetical protein
MVFRSAFRKLAGGRVPRYWDVGVSVALVLLGSSSGTIASAHSRNVCCSGKTKGQDSWRFGNRVRGRTWTRGKGITGCLWR